MIDIENSVWIISLIVSSFVFGAAHLGQGITGQLENAGDGMVLGAIYLACRRRLAVPIVAHGITDTLEVLLMFAGAYSDIALTMPSSTESIETKGHFPHPIIDFPSVET